MGITTARPLALVTGAATGIGLELAKLCAAKDFDLLIAADEPTIHVAARNLASAGVNVDAVEVDLAEKSGADELLAAVQGRPVAALLANAGRGLGHGFLDQDFADVLRVIDTNVIGTLYLIHTVGRDMRARGEGKILITGSVAGLMPGTYQAVYNGSKALLDSFSFALRAELKGSGVSVTCLMPAATEEELFERDEVAKLGFEAMMRGEGAVPERLRQAFEA